MLQCALLASEGNLTDVSWPTAIWTWVTFLFTVWALSKIAWPMLQKKMEERENRIREGLKKAEEAEHRAQELVEKQEAILQEARDDAHKLLAESRAAAEHIKNETIASAQHQIAQERDRARKEIELERERAVDELRRAAVDLTLDAASHVLERELKGEDQRRLAGEVIAKVDELR